MIDLPGRYRYQYRLMLQFGHWVHYYELIGARGGLHFHVSDHGEDYEKKYYGHRMIAGLEIHYRTPPDYMAHQPPSQDECDLLKAACWHDGTSLYAHDVLLPIFDGRDHEGMFRLLVDEADKRFAGERKMVKEKLRDLSAPVEDAESPDSATEATR